MYQHSTTGPVSKAHVVFNEHTLLETTLIDTLSLCLDVPVERIRLAYPNLHQFGTRALFQGTESIKNQELLEILKAPTSKDAPDGRNTKQARHLRSIGQERTLKLSTIRAHALNLMGSQRVARADIARAWAYAVMHHAAAVTVAETRKKVSITLDMAQLSTQPHLANVMLISCHELVHSTLKDAHEEASAAVASSIDAPTWQETKFLQLAAAAIIHVMDEPLLPTVAWGRLLQEVYPMIEACDQLSGQAAYSALLQGVKKNIRLHWLG